MVPLVCPQMALLRRPILRAHQALLRRPVLITKDEYLDLRLDGESAFLATSPEQVFSSWKLRVWYWWHPDCASKDDCSCEEEEEVVKEENQEIKKFPMKKQRIC